MSYFVPRFQRTHTVSFHLRVSIQYVSSQPRLNEPGKLWGHWFLLIFIICCTEMERKRGEGARKESLSSLCPLFFPLHDDGCSQDNWRKVGPAPCFSSGAFFLCRWLYKFKLKHHLCPPLRGDRSLVTLIRMSCLKIGI